MSSLTHDFSRLMQQAAEGDPNAFAQLFHHYNPILLDQLRSCLKKIRCLRPLLDPEDLAQDIWMDLATGALCRCQFPTPGHLLRYLARAARNKVRNAARDHLGAQKRDAHRHQSLNAAAVVADPSPTPAWTTEIREECERRLSSLTDVQQQAARLIGAGFSPAEIAWELRCSERTIARMMGEIRRALSSI